ncbi:MAG: asparagine synthase (glutamine-hydrolyzing) [Acidobacteriota bacterium]
MCGIAGMFLPGRAADVEAVRAMCAQIRHRGPDDEGFFSAGGCAIGMRRLSIIDLRTGHQPISNEDGSVWVVFNGEIYNYQELRSGLAQKGHRFTTNTDTETLVHLYEEEGADGLARLRGMFAFAIWDAARRKLFLARDRFGKKPLYYAALPEGLYFGSELKCLRAAGVAADLDEEALRQYFQLGYVPDPLSVFRAIRKLPPGCWLTYDAAGNIREGRYWSPPVAAAAPAPGLSETAAREKLRETFDEAVRMRMIADVPLGAFLSGGIDSSCVVASMALQSREPVRTFSIGFEESRFNELEYARMVAEKYRTEHHEILVKPDSIALVEKLVRHLDEPFGDSSAIPTFVVSEFAARHVKVALSGDGGDELFAGYTRFAAAQKMSWLDRVPRLALRLAAAAGRMLPYRAYGKNYLHMISRESPFERYIEANFAPFSMRERLLEPKWLRTAPVDCALLEGADTLSQAMYFETAVNLPGDMLVKVDRMSMANSLEVRCPLLDQEVAALAAAIPHAWRIRNGRLKDFLISAMQDRLPPALLTRPKMGFGVPLSIWFRTSLRAFLWDHLRSKRFRGRGFVRPAFVDHLLREHDTGRRDNYTWLWSLLMLELWLESLEPPGLLQ